jgi:fumarylacetoacetate (FAA) hydrolase
MRNLIPAELAKSFGFFQSKPATSFSPFAVTPDELGEHWQDGRVHLPLQTRYNGDLFGDPDAGPEMHFSFLDLIAHVAKTRSFTAGTILGSGTVSNSDRSRGSSCLAEKRMLEKIDSGAFHTPFMSAGDTVTIEMRDDKGANIFGTIDQRVSQS